MYLNVLFSKFGVLLRVVLPFGIMLGRIWEFELFINLFFLLMISPVCFLFLCIACKALEIVSPERHIDAYWLRYGSTDNSLEGRVVKAEPFVGCRDYENKEVTNSC